MRTTKGLLALVLMLTLASPATVFAQSAGDEQYTDPFQQENQGGADQGNQGGNQPQDGASEAAPPETAPPTSAPGDLTVDGSDAGGSTSAAQLPATGFPAGVLAAVGAGLLLSGRTLRRRM